jgi:HEAT repeat protein
VSVKGSVVLLMAALVVPAPVALPLTDARADQGHPAGAATQRTYDAVVQDIRSTDPATRVAAMRSLSAGGYPEALVPLSELLTDPVDEIQLEALDTVLGFFVVDRPPARRRVAGVIEVRGAAGAQAVYEAGPFELLPRPVPPQLVAGLAGAMRDQNPSVRVKATYMLGVVARPPVDRVAEEVLVAALRDPLLDMRVAAARVLGGLRVTGAGDALVAAMNDPDRQVRMAAMRSLGDIREARAVQALNEQRAFHGKGPEAEAAFDALARIAHGSSVAMFMVSLDDRAPLHRRFAAEGLARAGQPFDPATMARRAEKEKDPAARLAMAYALQTAGYDAMPRLVDALQQPRLEAQAMGYLVELGPRAARPLGAYLASPAPKVRERVAMTLGLIGGEVALAELDRAKTDPDREVMRAVERAIARAQMRRASS